MIEKGFVMHSRFAYHVKLTIITNWPRWREGQAERLQDMIPLNLEARCALMQYLLAPTWDDACNVLAASPIHKTGWPVRGLMDVINGGRLSKRDVEVLCQHIVLLELARLVGLSAARALLTLP